MSCNRSATPVSRYNPLKSGIETYAVVGPACSLQATERQTSRSLNVTVRVLVVQKKKQKRERAPVCWLHEIKQVNFTG